eukprot:5072210-Prymnesium_polylepis.1
MQRTSGGQTCSPAQRSPSRARSPLVFTRPLPGALARAYAPAQLSPSSSASSAGTTFIAPVVACIRGTRIDALTSPARVRAALTRSIR